MSNQATDSPTGLRFAWLVVALLFPVALLNYLDRQMIASMKSSVVAAIPMDGPEQSHAPGDSGQKNSTESQVNTNWGHMLGQFKWVYAFFSPIGGFLADRVSRRYTICASLGVWSVITYLTGTVTTYEGLLWTRTLMGISEAFYIPAALALISDYHLGSTRSKAVGIHQMGIYFGVILGGFSGYIADSPTLGWRWAFKWIGIIGVAYAVPLLVMLRDVPRQSAAEKQQVLLSLGQLVSNVSFLLLVAYFTLPALAGWVVRDWMPSILKESFNISQGKAGVSASLYWQLAAIVAAIVGGAWADQWMKRTDRGRIYVSAIGMTLIIPALILVGYATSGGASLGVAIGALILFGIGWGFFDINNMPILCQIARPELRATGYGLMNMVSISCGGFADRIFGQLKDANVPNFAIFGVFATVCVICVFMVLAIRPQNIEQSS